MYRLGLALLTLLALTCGVQAQTVMWCVTGTTPPFAPCSSTYPLAVSVAGGGGPVTIADGADVTQGALADTAATVGSTGSLSAKMRLITSQLDAINTALGLGVGTTGAAVPATAVYGGVNVGGNIVGIAPGTAGTPSTQVTTVQGATSMTPVLNTPTSQYPNGATAITASATGTTAATTATLAGVSNKTTYICSLSIRSNATAAATGNATVTGTITATMNFTHWTAPNASGLGVTEMIFNPCVPASAANTGIAVVSPAPGTGGVVSSTASGYQL